MLLRFLLFCLISSPVAALAFYKPVRVLDPELARVSCVSRLIRTDDASRHSPDFSTYSLPAGSWLTRRQPLFATHSKSEIRYARESAPVVSALCSGGC